MLVVTIEEIPGTKLEVLGIVKGSTIQSVHMGKDFMNELINLVGGEMTSYNAMMEEARRIAEERMEQEAERLGADAIVGLRYSSASVAQGAAEIMAYGTAVKYV